MSTRRRVTLLLICVAVGTAVNVVVATACLRWGRPDWAQARPIDIAEGDSYWGRYAQPDWPAKLFSLHRSNSTRVTEYTLIAMKDGNPDLSYAMTVMEAGWPLRSLRAAMRNTSRTPLVLLDTWVLDLSVIGYGWSHVSVPHGPIWSGLIVNTFFYTASVWLVIRGPWEMRRRWRELHGRCGWCAYPYGSSSTCTECGKPIPQRPRAARSS